jgi:hypothetical protein
MKNFSLHSPNEIFTKFNIKSIWLNNVVCVTNVKNPYIQKHFDPKEFNHKLNDDETIFVGDNGGNAIRIYNHDFKPCILALKKGRSLQEAELEYFEGIERNQILDLYIKSSLSHEIAHNIWNSDIYINKELFLERQNIIKEYKSLTKYAEIYNKEDFFDEESYILYLNENFAEAVRVYTVNPTYLEKKFPKAYTFIQTNCPFIQPVAKLEKKVYHTMMEYSLINELSTKNIVSFIDNKGKDTFQLELHQSQNNIPPIAKDEYYGELHIHRDAKIEDKISILQECKTILEEYGNQQNITIRYILSDSRLNDEEFLEYYRQQTGKKSRIWNTLQETKKYAAENGGALQLKAINPKKYDEHKKKRITNPHSSLAKALETYEKEGHKLKR